MKRKKKVSIVSICLLAIGVLLLSVGVVQARGGPNGKLVHSGQRGMYDCYVHYLKTGSGLVHQWRDGFPSCAPVKGTYSLHLVFKPVSKFKHADCDREGYLWHTSTPWKFYPGLYTDMSDDEADLADFLTPFNEYWVCFYEWTE